MLKMICFYYPFYFGIIYLASIGKFVITLKTCLSGELSNRLSCFTCYRKRNLSKLTTVNYRYRELPKTNNYIFHRICNVNTRNMHAKN